jgi:SAM-dependent methyltransferase
MATFPCAEKFTTIDDPRTRQAEFRDPRLVPVYDVACPWSRDDDFFLSIVNETQQSRVLDLGCGTGRLALGMAAAGHAVTGVDPAQSSLAAARAKPGADQVTWIEGTSPILPSSTFDTAVMTSHVAQFFVEDTEWQRALADLRRSLVQGGRLVFDTRDPRAREWGQWNPTDSRYRVTLSDGREVEGWTEVTAVRDGRVSFTMHYRFPDGEELLSTATLRFRTEDEVRASLQGEGFDIEQVYGGWNRQPIGMGDGEFLVLAVRR